MDMTDDLVSHPAFSLLSPWMVAEVYGRDTNRGGRPRRRVELRRAAPPQVVKIALGVVVACPKCGERMSPFRQRLGSWERGPQVRRELMAIWAATSLARNCSRSPPSQIHPNDGHGKITPKCRTGTSSPSIYFAAACPELPERTDVDAWAMLALDPDASEDDLRGALLGAAASFKTCCKGSAARDAHEAVVSALESGTPAPGSQESLW